jgi:bifunctional DNase/RNase
VRRFEPAGHARPVSATHAESASAHPSSDRRRFGALGAKVERVIINGFRSDAYFGKLVLSVENELTAKQRIELDARPSDSMALATQQRASIYVSLEV